MQNANCTLSQNLQNAKMENSATCISPLGERTLFYANWNKGQSITKSETHSSLFRSSMKPAAFLVLFVASFSSFSVLWHSADCPTRITRDCAVTELGGSTIWRSAAVVVTGEKHILNSSLLDGFSDNFYLPSLNTATNTWTSKLK